MGGRGGRGMILGLWCWLASAAAPAAAQPADAEIDEAREAFVAAQAAYEGGDFEDALALFRRAYALTQDPEIAYNVGVVAERLRLDREALQAYETYLAARPDVPERANIERRMAILRRAIAAEPGSRTNGPEPERAPSEEPADGGGGPGLAPWIATGGAVLLAGLATTFWIVGDAEYADLEASCPCTEAEIEASSVSTFDTLTTVALIAAIGTSALAVTLFALDSGGGDETGPAASVRLAPGALVLRGAW